VKTREGLFAQLSDELVRYVELEEQHFLPLLRKHPDTKDLAAGALKGNKDLRASWRSCPSCRRTVTRSWPSLGS
jgi:hypothetical protein